MALLRKIGSENKHDGGDGCPASHPDVEPDPALPFALARPSSGSLGTMAIDYLNNKGGSIYLPAWRAKALVDEGQFHMVQGAPEILQPVHAVYRKHTDKNEIYDAAIDSLRAFSPSHNELQASSLEPPLLSAETGWENG